MNGSCGGPAPRPLPLLVGPSVDRCPVWLGQQEDATDVEFTAADLFFGRAAPDSGVPTPFLRSLMRTVAEWKAESEAARVR